MYVNLQTKFHVETRMPVAQLSGFSNKGSLCTEIWTQVWILDKLSVYLL